MGASHPEVCFSKEELLSGPSLMTLSDESFKITPRRGDFFHETVYEVPFPLELDDDDEPIPQTIQSMFDSLNSQLRRMSRRED